MLRRESKFDDIENQLEYASFVIQFKNGTFRPFTFTSGRHSDIESAARIDWFQGLIESHEINPDNIRKIYDIHTHPSRKALAVEQGVERSFLMSYPDIVLYQETPWLLLLAAEKAYFWDYANLVIPNCEGCENTVISWKRTKFRKMLPLLDSILKSKVKK